MESEGRGSCAHPLAPVLPPELRTRVVFVGGLGLGPQLHRPLAVSQVGRIRLPLGGI